MQSIQDKWTYSLLSCWNLVNVLLRKCCFYLSLSLTPMWTGGLLNKGANLIHYLGLSSIRPIQTGNDEKFQSSWSWLLWTYASLDITRSLMFSCISTDVGHCVNLKRGTCNTKLIKYLASSAFSILSYFLFSFFLSFVLYFLGFYCLRLIFVSTS